MKSFFLIVSVLIFASKSHSQVTDVDGNSYKTTVIGSQTWMAENYKVAHFRNGDTIRELKSRKEWLEAIKNKEPGWSYYKNKKNAEYGKIYNHYAVYDSRDLAPEGWHIAGADNDWYKLIRFLEKDTAAFCAVKQNVLTSLKSTEGWKYNNGTNTTGFDAKPFGLINYKGRFKKKYFNRFYRESMEFAIWHNFYELGHVCWCAFDGGYEFCPNCEFESHKKSELNIGYYIRCVKD
jgi:uncharacterized protein (TIGR02145 family)